MKKYILMILMVLISGCSGQKPLESIDQFNKELALRPPGVGAMTYYLDPVNGSMNNLGTKDSPWSTLKDVIESSLIEYKDSDGVFQNAGGPVQSGDTIILMNGYHGSVMIDGYYNDEEITVRALDGSKPGIGSLTIKSSRNWSFSGLVISPSIMNDGIQGSGIVSVDGDDKNGKTSNITLKNSYIYSESNAVDWSDYDWTSRAINGIYLGDNASNILIENVFLNNVREGIYVRADNTVIKGSVIKNFAKNGVRIDASDLVVSDNVIRNAVGGSSGSGIRVYHRKQPVWDVVITGNIIIDNDGTRDTGNDAPGIASYSDELTNFQVESNVIQTGAHHGISLYYSSGSKIQNNIVLGTDNRNKAKVILLALNDVVENMVVNNQAQAFVFDKNNKGLIDLNNTVESTEPEIFGVILDEALVIKNKQIEGKYCLESNKSELLRVDLLAMGLPNSDLVCATATDIAMVTEKGVVTNEPEVISKASSLTQFGITWFFDKEYQVGTFANGDYWVLGPVEIVKITPQSLSGERVMNGSMLNPVDTVNEVQKYSQGYDSAMYGMYGTDTSYADTLNVALNVSASAPLVIAASNSLVSTISLDAAGSRPQLETAAILTVVEFSPAEGSFRPSYSLSDKTIHYNKNELDYSKLGTLPLTDEILHPKDQAEYFERPWIDHASDWTGRYMHPSSNMPDYGREIAYLIGDAGLSLMLDYTNKEKEVLLVRLVQFGIDTYGLAATGNTWQDLGGHMQGRKLPMLLAGVVLNDQDIINMANGEQNLIFQEDRQTWLITDYDIGRSVTQYDGKLRETYLMEDRGMAEWGEQHLRRENKDNRRWDAAYRKIVGSSILGHVLTARLLGVEDLWNWPALFAYSDRFWDIEKDNTSKTNGMKVFTKSMWLKYSHCAKTQCI